jgi:hypothetical protein
MTTNDVRTQYELLRESVFSARYALRPKKVLSNEHVLRCRKNIWITATSGITFCVVMKIKTRAAKEPVE